jgi:hypothetical protein
MGGPQNSHNAAGSDRATTGAATGVGGASEPVRLVRPLTRQERLSLNEILCLAYDVPGLIQLTELRLGTPLAAMTAIVGARLPEIVLGLVGYYERRGMAAVDRLIDALRADRPTVEGLAAFAEGRRQRLLAPPDPADAALWALEDLEEGARNQPEIAEIIAPVLRVFAGQLEAAGEAILRLGRYKSLHDTLHKLQLKLGVILQAVGRLRGDGPAAAGASRELDSYALDLRRLVVVANRQAAGLPPTDREREYDWIGELDDAAIALRGADVESRAQVAEQIKNLQNQRAPQINFQLAEIAHNMPLGGIVDALEALRAALQPAGQALPARVAAEGCDAMRLLVPQLDALVSQHKQWQLLEKDLALAESKTEQWRPEERIPKWDRFNKRLAELCIEFQQQQWSVELLRILADWQDHALNDDQQGSIVAFVNLRGGCRSRFFDVDSELDQLCGRLTGITAPLRTLQELAKQ